jgi:osmotically-inducible protein OsmY
LIFGQTQEVPATDNTKTNARDRNTGDATADQQKENSSDRKLTKDIRRALMKDDSLSTYAHNIKIISQNGKVTLKGPVRSDEEKQAIEAKATEIAGSGNVTDQLQIADQDQKQ